jgi:hypothetical protein
VNSRQRATLVAVFTEPVPAALPWREVESLLRALGAELTEGRGSRLRVALGGVRAVFHRPHPSPACDRGMIRSIRTFLLAAGVEP